MELTLDQALQKGVEAHKAGQVQEADRLYTAILKVQPKHSDANHNMGVLAVGVDKVQEALPFFKAALEANPSTAQFWLSYIDALIKLDRLTDAKAVLDQAKDKGAKGEAFDELEQRLQGIEPMASIAPRVQDPPQALQQSLMNLYSQGQLKQALEQATTLLQQFPNSSGLYNICGAVYKRLGQLDASVEAYTQAIAIKPDHAEVYYNMGIALQDQGKLEEAIVIFNKALAIKPDFAEAYNIMGNALKEQGTLEEAIKAYNKALAIKPDYAEAYSNMGIALHAQGKLDEAIAAYSKGLTINPNVAEAYSNMGVVFQERGKLEEAIGSYSKALEIKPDHAEAYYNMGNVLQEQGKPEEAIEAYNKALAIKPDHAEAYYNMGVVLQEQGKLEEAVKAYNKALAIKPDYAYAWNNMGNAFEGQVKMGEAIEAYTKALALKPDNAEAYRNMGIALKGVVFKKANSDLQKIITSMLNHKTYVRPFNISPAAISLLKFEPILLNVLERYSKSQLIVFLNETVLNLSELPLLLKLMSVCPLADLELEGVFTDIRSGLLSSVSELESSSEVLRFQSALALQCFTNEYIYDQSKIEEKALGALEARVSDNLSGGKQPSSQSILCLASYKALHEYEWCDLVAITSVLEEVFTRQVMEPKQEARIKPDIPVLKEIANKVSAKVQEQYEESPYPRWVNLGLTLRPAPIPKVVTQMKLKLFGDKINEVGSPCILIAGCGTGQHSIETATRFKNSKVLAIDLSLSSLSFAKRKTEELGVTNIDYMQADILDLDKLGRQFDIVESLGVLHHMDDPMAGWRVLTDCLKPGGLMKIGLYSECARQHIGKMREEISKSDIASSDNAMKSFRNGVINSDKDHHKQIHRSLDFYSLSTLRDLLFHVQEHRFTIPQIKDYLSELGLEFCGFEAENIVADFKLENTGQDDPYNLDKWNLYEGANPTRFVGMYQFWCQKVS